MHWSYPLTEALENLKTVKYPCFRSCCNYKTPTLLPAVYLNIFFYNSFRPLLDVDECTNDQHSCHPLAKCSNTEGSYTCSCVLGYQGDGILQCAGAYIYCVISALFNVRAVFSEVSKTHKQTSYTPGPGCSKAG